MKRFLAFIIVAALSLFAQSTRAVDGTWNLDGSANWGTGPWLGGVPNGIGEVAAFTNNIGADRDVTNETTRTVGALLFGDVSGNSAFRLRGSGLTMDVAAGPVLIGNHYSGASNLINVASITLNDNLMVTSSISGGWVMFQTPISGSGKSITFTGNGASDVGQFAMLSNSTYSGGTTVRWSRVSVQQNNALGTGLVVIEPTGQVWLAGNVVLTNAVQMSGPGWREGAGNLGAFRLSGGSRIAGPVTMAGDSRLTVYTATDLAEVSGAITGPFTLDKTGNGSLYLTADNSYGGTLISAGTVQVGRVTSTGSLGYGPTTNNAVLQFLRTTDLTVSNDVLGTGKIRQLGASATVTLLGSNSMGNLSVSSGRAEAPFVFGPGSTNLVTGTLEVGVNALGDGTLGRLVISENTKLRVDGNFLLGNQVNRTGDVVQVGGDVSVGGTFRVGHYAGNYSTYVMEGGTFRMTANVTANPFGPGEQNGALYVGIDGSGLFRQNGGDVITPAIVLDNRGQTAGTDIYTLAGGNLFLGQWGVQGNQDARFDAGGGSLIASNNLLVSVPFHLTNITGVTKISVPASGFVTLSNAFGMGSAIVTNGTLVLADVGGRKVLGGDLTLIGGGEIRHTGSGTMLLTGENSIGGLVVSNGTLGYVLEASAGGASSPITVAGGLLQVDGTTVHQIESHTLNWDSFNGGIDVASPYNTVVVTTNITGSGSFTKAGAGTLVMTGSDHAYSGATVVSNGTLRLVGGNDPLNVESEIRVVRGTLDLGGYSQEAQNGVNLYGGAVVNGTINSPGLFGFDIQAGHIGVDLDGNVGIVKSTGGVATLAGDNGFTGDVSLNSGTVQIVRDANLGNGGELTFNGGRLAIVGSAISNFNSRGANWAGFNGGIDIVSSNYTFTLNNLISGGGSFTKGGGGAMVMNVAHTYSGNTIVSNGTLILAVDQATTGGTLIGAGSATLQMGTGGTAGWIGGAITNNGTLRFVRSDTIVLPNIVTGGGAVEQRGAGTLIITNALTTGNFFPKQGSVVITNGGIVQATGYTSVGQMAGDNGRLVVNGSGILRTTGDLNIGDLTGSRGLLLMQDAAVVTGRTLYVGKNGNAVGVLMLSNGQLRVGGAGDNRIGGGAGATDAKAYGYIGMSGGLLHSGNNFQLGAYGIGAMDMTGGIFTNTTWLTPGRWPGGFGQMNLLGGTTYVHNTGTGIIVGENGTSDLNIQNALVMIDGRVRFGGTGTGVLNLATGGLLATPWVERTGGEGFVNFHGGTLRLTSTSATSMQSVNRVTVWQEGGTLEITNGVIATVRQNIEAPLGNGVTSIAVNDAGSGYVGTPYVRISGGGGTGATAIAEVDFTTGTITNFRITNPGHGYITPPTIAIYGGGAASSAYAGTVTIAASPGSGAFVKSGGGMLSLLGTNTYSGGTVINGGLLAFGAGSVNGAWNQATGSLPVAGNVLINAGGGLVASGVYANANAWLASGRVASNSAGTLALTPVSAAESIDLSTVAGGSYTGIYIGAAQGSTILYRGTLTPAGNEYRIGGGGGTLILNNDLALTGARSLTVGNGTGSNTVVWAGGSNSFSGGTTVDGSMLSFAGQDNLGTSTRLDVRSGGVQIRGGTVQNFLGFTGSQTNIAGTMFYDIANIGNTFTENRDITVTGGLTKWGQGTLVLGGSNQFAGAVSVGNGVLHLTDSDAISGVTTVGVVGVTLNANTNKGAALWLSGGITIDKPLSLMGRGVNDDGALRSLDAGNTYSGPITILGNGFVTTKIASDAGLFTLSGPITNLAAGQIASFGGAGDLLVSGVLAGGGAMMKMGPGTMTMTASNTYTGGTYLFNGTMALDFAAGSAPAQSILPANAALNTYNGTLKAMSASSGNSTQNFATVAVQQGYSVVVATNIGSGTMAVNLGTAGPTRGTGLGILDLRGDGIITVGSQATNAAGQLPAYTVVNGADFASLGAGNKVIPFAYYTNPLTATMPSFSGAVVRVSAATPAGDIAIGTAVASIQSLLVNDAAARTLTMTGTGALRVGGASTAAGAILLAPGAGQLTIGAAANDGLLTGYYAANSATELLLINNSANPFTVNAAIVNNGSGATPVTLGGYGTGGFALNGTNFTTGRLYVDSGNLAVNGVSQFGGMTAYAGTSTLAAATTLAGSLQVEGDSVVNINAPVTLTGNNAVQVGNQLLSRAVLNLNANLTAGLGGGRLQDGAGTSIAGAVNHNSGTFLNNGNTVIGDGNQNWASYKITGGLLTTSNQEMNVGWGSHGVVDILGGAVVASNNQFVISRGDGTRPTIGIVNVDGGLLQIAVTNNNLVMNNTGNARSYAQLSVMSGVVDASSILGTRYIDMMVGANNTSTFNLVGGTVTANQIRATSAGLSVLNFDGGTLVIPANAAYGAQTITGLSAAYVNDGGAIIEANTNSTIRTDLSGVFGKGLASIPVADGGAGYIGNPVVRVMGGSGTGATAIAQVDTTTGAITNILVTSAGSGYLADDVLNVQLIGGGFTTAATLGSYTFAQNVNTGGLTKTGPAPLTLMGANSYGGLTSVDAGTLHLANTGGTNLMTGGITGAGTLEQTGNGMSIIGGDGSAFFGQFNVNSGVVQFASLAAAPAGAGQIVLGNGGAIALDGVGVQSLINLVSGSGAIAVTPNSANENVDFFTANLGNTSLGAVGTVTYGGTLTRYGDYRLGGGGGTLIFTNSTVSGAGVRIGLTEGVSSTVRVPNMATNAFVTVNRMGVLDIAGASQAVGGLAGDGLVVNTSAGAATLTVGSEDATSTFGGAIVGGIGLTKTGTGTLSLTNANTYSGATIVDAGTLKLSPATVAGPLFAGMVESYTNIVNSWSPTSLTDLGVVTYPRFAETNMTGVNSYPPVWPTVWPNNVTIGYRGYVHNNSGSNVVWSFASNIDDASRLLIDGAQVLNTAGNNSAGTNTVVLAPGAHLFDYRIQNGTGGAGSYGIFGSGVTGIGFGYDPLGRASTFAGDYLIPADMGDGTFFSTGLNILPATTTVSIASSAILDLNGAAQMIAALSDHGGGGGLVTNSAATASWLTLNPQSGSTTFSGNIDDAGTTATGIGLYKTGAGTQVLSGSNTYAGGTFVMKGVLQFNAADAVSPDSKITVTPGAAAAMDFTGVNAVLSRISGTSSGSVAITATSANEALNFNAAGLAGSHLGAVGSVTYTGVLTPHGSTYRLGGYGTLDYAPAITSGSLVIGGGSNGPSILSTVILTNANSFAGGTTINNGALRIGSDAALGAIPGSAATNLTFNGGMLQAGGDGIVLGATRSILVNMTRTGMVDTAGYTMKINGRIEGTNATFTKIGSGTLILGSATNSITSLVIAQGGFSNAVPTGLLSNMFVGTMSGGATARFATNMAIAGRLYVGYGADRAGAVIQSGGTTTVGTTLSQADVLSLGNNGGYGYYRMENGLLDVGQLGIGGNSAGGNSAVFDQLGGIVRVTQGGGWLLAGWSSSSNGVLNIWNGTMYAPPGGNNVSMGFAANINSYAMMNVLGDGAVLNTSTGSTTRAIDLMVGGGNAAGIMNVNNGGRVLANQFRAGNAQGYSVLNLDGGIIIANSNLAQSAFMQGLSGAYVYDGGATIDTTNSQIGIHQALLQPIGYGITNIALTSGGAGYIGAPVVRITGGSGTGATAVAQIDMASGTITNLYITSMGSGYLPTDSLDISLVGGGAATPAVLGTVGWNTNSPSGGLVKMGPGTLMLGGDSTYLGGTVVSNGNLQIGMGGTTGSVVGAITFMNPSSWFGLARSDVITNGYSLVTPNGTIAALAQNGRGGTLVLTNPVQEFKTVAVNTGNVLFATSAAIPGVGATITNMAGSNRGAILAAGAYDGAQAWMDSGRIASNFAGAIALMGSTSDNLNMLPNPQMSIGAAPGTAVTYLGTLTPATNTYYIGGGGGELVMGLPDQLVDNGRTNRNVVIGNGGGGSVRLFGANSYNGGTLVNNGTLIVEHDAAMGTGPLTINGGGAATGTLQIVNAPAFATTRTIVFGTGGQPTAIDVTAGSTATLYGVVGGSGDGFIYKMGTGTLILSNTAWNTAASLFERFGTTIIDSGAFVGTLGRYHNVGFTAGDSATLTIRGSGTFTNSGDFNIADVGGTGTLNVQDSGVLRAATYYVGKAGVGVANQAGDIYIFGNTILGNAAGASGTITQTGGIFSASDVRFSPNATATSTDNLNGGIQVVRGTQFARVWQPTNTGSAVFNLNGGTLLAGNNFVISNLTTMAVGAGGGTLDPSNFVMTVRQLVSGAGTLTINSASTGTVLMAVSNTFTGSTLVNGGVLVYDTTNAMSGTGRNITANLGGTVVMNLGTGPSNLLSRMTTTSVGTIALMTNIDQAVDLRGNGMSNLYVGAIGTVGISGNTITNFGSTYKLGGGWGRLIVSNGIAPAGIGTNLIAFGGGSGGSLVFLGTNKLDTYTVNGGIVQFASVSGMVSRTTTRPVTVNRGGTVAPTGAVALADYLARIDVGSSGTVALVANNATAVDFNTAGLTALSLGAANGTWTQSGTITPAAGSYRLGGGTGTLVFTNRNLITGANTLMAFGSGSGGTLVLNNTNDFTGGTWIGPTGTVQIGSLYSLGTGPVTNNGALVFQAWAGGAGSYTGVVPVVMSGSGSVTLNSASGTNQVILTNAWAHTGGTTIRGGALLLSNATGNALSGNITIGDSAGSDVLSLRLSDQIADNSVLTFNSGPGGSSAFLQMNGKSETIGGIIATNSGMAPVIEGNSGTSLLTINNALPSIFDGYIRDQSGKISITKGGAGQLTLISANITYTGPTVVNSGVLMLSNTTAFASDVTINDGHLLLGTRTAANNRNITNNAVNGLAFGTFTNAYTIGMLSGTGNVALIGGNGGGVALTLGNQGNALGTYSGVLSDAGPGNYYMGSVIKIGTSTQVLAGANTYRGGTTISAGGLLIDRDENLGYINAPVTMNGGTLIVTNTMTMSDRTMTVTAGSRFSVWANSTLTLTNDIVGTQALTKDGVGMLVLDNDNSNYSGIWNVQSGIVRVAHSYGLGAWGVGSVNNNMQGAVDGSAHAMELIGGITISGKVMYTSGNGNAPNTGVLRNISGTNQWLGNIIMTGGAGATTLGSDSGQLVIGGSIEPNTAGRTLTFTGAGDFRVNGGISNGLTVNMPVFKNGAGTLTLSGDNQYSGQTLISAGTVQVGNGGATGVLGSGTVSNNAMLAFNRNNDMTVGNLIVGTGAVEQRGSGRTILTNVNTYTGMTRVMAGVLELSGAGSINNSTTLQIDAGAKMVVTGMTATMNLNAGQTLQGVGTFEGGLITDSGSFVKPGTSAGALTVNGDWTMSAGSEYTVELNGLTAGSQYDQLVFGAGYSLTLTNPELSILLGFAPALGNSFVIMNGVNTGAFNGFTDNTDFQVPHGGTNYTVRIDYNRIAGGDATDDITLTVIPEPLAAGLVGIMGLAGWLLRRRLRGQE